MKISFSGYKIWKHIKNELEISEFYILPSIFVSQDRTFGKEDYPTIIKFAWLFWQIDICLNL